MTIKELRHQIRAYKAAYTNANKLEMEMYQRFTIPLASFVFALVGAPLGLQNNALVHLSALVLVFLSSLFIMG